MSPEQALDIAHTLHDIAGALGLLIFIQMLSWLTRKD